ncbi:hypothetical protein LTSEGIV_1909, partial [Salmonella enterica subsp. enterica serovar Give str. S5-487]
MVERRHQAIQARHKARDIFCDRVRVLRVLAAWFGM